MLKSNLRSALLGSGAAIAMVAVAAPASAGELESLKDQIDALQNKLDALETRQDVVETQDSVAPAAAVEAGDKPKSWKLPGTNTSMNIGGYAKLDFMYTWGATGLGDTFSAVAIPSESSVSDNRSGEFRANARQSRIWFKTWTPTDWGELATHIEGDFYGNGGSEVANSSTSFRARHLYGRLGPVLAGQTWSNFIGIESGAETLDFSGPVGVTSMRQPQLRYTHVFGGSGFTGIVSLENAETTGIGNGNAATSLGAGNGISIDRAPDFAAKLKYKHSKGVIVGRALVRGMGMDNGTGTVNIGTAAAPNNVRASIDDGAVAWGLGVNGTWRFGPKDAIGAEFNYGYGIGRYMVGSSGLGASCTNACAPTGSGANSADFDLELSTNWGGSAWYQHKWTDTIRTNVAFGYAQNEVDTNPGTVGSLVQVAHTKSIATVHGNVIWSPVKQVNFGLELMYGNRLIHQAGSNDAMRLQLGMQYKF